MHSIGKQKNMWSQIDIQQDNKGIHWSKELSTESVWSFLKIPFCPITWAALGACPKAFSSAAFHSYKSSIVSACKTNKKSHMSACIRNRFLLLPHTFWTWSSFPKVLCVFPTLIWSTKLSLRCMTHVFPSVFVVLALKASLRKKMPFIKFVKPTWFPPKIPHDKELIWWGILNQNGLNFLD